ncbi:MAG: dihydrolipoamide acetyltransferase family protein [Burkholderiaceae bacterium]
MADFTMPALGADMQTGKVVQWLVKPGEHVHRGDVVAVVETHKGAIDVEIFLDGVIDELAPLDAELPVGAVLARVRVAGEAAPQRRWRPRPLRSSPQQRRHRARRRNRIIAVAPARGAPARTSKLGVDLATLTGSGIGGALTLADVERAAAGTAPAAAAPPPARGFDAAQMRIAIAAAMARSKREIPHYYLSEAITMRRALDWLQARNAAAPVTQRLLPAVLLIKAVALALRGSPQLNGHWVDGGFRPSAPVHVGVAVSLRGGGLVAPAIHDVQAKPLAALMAELADLVQRARSGRIRSSEITDPTITVSNLGDQGVDAVFGVIYPPQVALVGFGRIAERPGVADGLVCALPMVTASLAADHRASDGHAGARFLGALAEQLQQPEAL